MRVTVMYEFMYTVLVPLVTFQLWCLLPSPTARYEARTVGDPYESPDRLLGFSPGDLPFSAIVSRSS